MNIVINKNDMDLLLIILEEKITLLNVQIDYIKFLVNSNYLNATIYIRKRNSFKKERIKLNELKSKLIFYKVKSKIKKVKK